MGRDENYGQFLDMLDLVMWLQESVQGVTLGEIRDRFGVSRRTAERMRDAVANWFGPDLSVVRDGPRKLHKLRSRRLDPVILSSVTEDHLASFKIAGDLMRRHNLAEQARRLEEAGSKLRSLVKPGRAKVMNLEDRLRSEGLALRPGPRISYDEAMVAAIRDALMSFRQIRILHAPPGKEPHESVLVPLGLLYGDHNQYLVARYAEDPQRRIFHFALDRISRLERLDAVFEEDRDFDLAAHAANSFGAWQEKPFEVEWLFKPSLADAASKFVFHPSQTLERRPDGSLLVRFTAGGRLEMAWHLYTWGEGVKVLKPKNFWSTLPEGYPRMSD